MNINAYPEAYINTTSELNISNSYNVILCSNVLKKFEQEILENATGCLFKLTYNNIEFGCESTIYVSCLEFSAPLNTCFLPNNIFDDLLMDINIKNEISIEPFYPPQATLIKFQVFDTLIDRIDNIKEELETLLTKDYKFLRLHQKIPLLDEEITIISLEPYNICLINNTDLEVEFDIMKKVPIQYPVEKNITNQIEEVNIENQVEELPRLTQEELRLKRLEFFKKK
jgi:hypothetical protein